MEKDDVCQACGGKADGCLTCQGTGLSLPVIVKKLRELEARLARLESSVAEVRRRRGETVFR